MTMYIVMRKMNRLIADSAIFGFTAVFSRLAFSYFPFALFSEYKK